jgi:cystathionine gamma-synthase
VPSDQQPDAHPETVLIAAGRPPRQAGAPLVPPISPAATFVAGGRDGYARDDVPAARGLEEVLGRLESGTAIAFSSGMAAAAALLDRLPLGGVIGVADPGYSGLLGMLDHQASAGRLTVRRLDPFAPDPVGCDLLWLEVIGNPMMQATDLATVLPRARAAGVRTVVDATLATPLRVRPLALGADAVLHSATKSISGHADLLMGVAITADVAEANRIAAHRRRFGAVPSAFDCWLALRGARTLAVRLDRAEATARYLLERLAAHRDVQRVHYPGFGTMLAIEVSDAARADAICSSVRLWAHATSLGGDESSLERRRRWAAESPAVPESLIRLSVGLEHPEDLWVDLSAALDAG